MSSGRASIAETYLGSLDVLEYLASCLQVRTQNRVTRSVQNGDVNTDKRNVGQQH